MAKCRADSHSLQSHSITIIADISGVDQRQQRCEIGGTRCDISCQRSFMAVGYGTDCTPACGRQAVSCITGSLSWRWEGWYLSKSSYRWNTRDLFFLSTSPEGIYKRDHPSIKYLVVSLLQIVWAWVDFIRFSMGYEIWWCSDIVYVVKFQLHILPKWPLTETKRTVIIEINMYIIRPITPVNPHNHQECS